ncbi:hypothetical protein [Cryptosporangium sp. NPDC051539]|uniref:hypothetical protein n=1 Tax=Cryptosporangium sp. NPDC051539 TaxID=3363962 RepID=UPI0037A2CDE4
MRRRTFDAITTSIGIGLTLVLLIAGGLALWGCNFANNPYLNKYAGQKLTRGDQAQAYADHFIAVHLREIADGKTYAQVSSAAQADPNNAQLQQQANTLFKGEALRSMLLEAYAFWKIGQIALWAALTSFVAAAVIAVLSILGAIHLRRTDTTAEPDPTAEPDTATTPETATTKPAIA